MLGVAYSLDVTLDELSMKEKAMLFTPCPDCGREISTKASICIRRGLPMGYAARSRREYRLGAALIMAVAVFSFAAWLG